MKERLRLLLKKVLEFLGIKVGDSVDYISVGNSLPSPLTPEEEAETVARYLAGDKEARLTLIERNLRLVVYIAKRFDNTGSKTRYRFLYEYHGSGYVDGLIPDVGIYVH